MLTGLRTWAAGSFALAAFLALVSLTPAVVAFWILPGLGMTGWVQWKAWRGTHVERARLWYAAAPLWLLSLVPVVLALPLDLADRVMYVAAAVVGACATQVRSLLHERMLDRLHGPVVHDTHA